MGYPYYALSGKWFFDYAIELKTHSYQKINFTSNSKSLTAMTLDYDGLTYVQFHEGNYNFDVYQGNSYGWLEGKEYRIIDFGTTPQEVTQEFYDVFTSIAKPVPSNLTNTEWNVPSGWPRESKYGLYYLIGSLNGYSFLSNYNPNFGIGYELSSTGKELSSWGECVSGITDGGFIVGKTQCTNSKHSFNLVISGDNGSNDDTLSNQDPSLITWLCTYGDLTESEEEQTYTLSGKWLINKTISVANGVKQEIEFTSDFSYSGFGCENDTLLYYDAGDYDIGGTTAYVNDSWYSSVLRTVDFGSTSQAVSKEFYEWFIANAKPSITDLTGYTVTLPSVWSHSFVDTTFNVSGRAFLDTTIDSTKEFSELRFFEHDEADLINIGGVWWGTSDLEVSSTFTFTGGTDATNPDLIQWFYDNNATFEKMVTDLTNTTWNVPSGWSATKVANYYLTCQIVNPSDDSNTYDLFSTGHGGDDEIRLTKSDNSSARTFYPSQSFTLHITSGEDATNPDLIKWLTTYGTQLKVTDLTNTTWKYTVTNVVSPGTVTHTGSYSVNGTINGVSFDTLLSGVKRGSYTDGIVFNDIILFPDGVSFTGSIGDEYIISFTDGTDSTNPKLIAWLSKWGELQETYTLSGTWKFNETLNLPSVDATQYESCEFVSNGIALNVFRYYYFELSYANNITGDSIAAMYYNGQGWLKPEYRTITFEGTQTVSQEFYTWFTANAKPMITDLTGYTVTVPSGWSATAGYGIFSVYGLPMADLDDKKLTKLYIGYWNFQTTASNKIYIGGSGSHIIYPNGVEICFTITGGKDVSNPSLIQWLYDNNATFEKTSEEITQTLTVINSNNPSETATFTMPKWLYFYEYIENFDTEFDIQSDYDYVTYKGVPITDSNGGYIQSGEIAVGTFYYKGEGQPEEPDTPSIPTTPHGEIYYKGNLVATLVEGETIVLHTKDFKFLGDIVIKNVGESNLISFTIDGVEYKAEEGMTWGEWVDSAYNTDGFRSGAWTGLISKISAYYIYDEVTQTFAGLKGGDTNGNEVHLNIIPNTNYITKHYPHNGAGND